MQNNIVIKKLRRIERLLKKANSKPLNLKEASKYIGITESYMYKLTSQKLIPHYKPYGKLIYFKKNELDRFVLKNKILTHTEMDVKAIDKLMSMKGKKSSKI
jgi:excisionase family DNA binding protein